MPAWRAVARKRFAALRSRVARRVRCSCRCGPAERAVPRSRSTVETREHRFSGGSVGVVLLGRKDLSQGAISAQVASRIALISGTLLASHGCSHVVIESVLPEADSGSEPERLELNYLLSRIPNRTPGISYLDLSPEFCRYGKPDPALFLDGVHLTPAGICRRLRLEVAHLRRVVPQFGGRVSLLVKDCG